MPVFRGILDVYMKDSGLILDPFAGIGTVHKLRNFGWNTWGIEIEPEWAIQSPSTLIGDATHLPFVDKSFSAILTSPVFANRMSDHHNAKDGSFRRTYKHFLGKDLHPNNAGAMQWGEDYKSLHFKAWKESVRVLKPNGIFILNIKDHFRKFKRIHVSNWHHQTLKGLGLQLVDVIRVETQGFRFGENRDRLPERVLVYERHS